MKIALVNDFLPNTGIGNYAFSLFGELKKSVDVEMVYLQMEKCKKPEKTEKLSLIETSFSFPVLNRTLQNSFFFPKKIQQNYDLIHCSNQFLSKIAKYNKPCIVSCMDIIPKVLPKEYPTSLRFFLNNSMKSIKEAERIITISDYTKKELIEHYNIPKEKIKTVYLGFNEKIFRQRGKILARKKLNLDLNEKIVLNVGSEEERKNISTLLKAIAIAKKSIPETKLIRVGEQRKNSIELIKKLGIEENVKYVNSVELNDLGLYYNACDIFVFPSYYEGFGLPLLEAMASGAPVLTTNKTSIPEIVGKSAEIFSEFDEKMLSEKIANFLQNEKLLEKFSKKGLEQSEKFSWKKCSEETLEVYNEVVA